jgi:proton-translocating NADH-quinone oxidoreductase chain L
MFLLLIFLPFFNFFIIWITELFLGKYKAILLIVHAYVMILVLSFFIFWKVCITGEFYYLTLGTWINCGLFIVNWGFIFDSLSVIMLVMVSFISGLVHVYSAGYMREDYSLIRFMSYLSLFTFFMFILVSADNFIQLFLGWEGIGLCSYLLISFWNTRVQANKAALKALIVNRIGDFGFLFGLCILFYFFRSVDFSIVFVLSPYFKEISLSILGHNFGCLNCICFFLFIGSIGKSAQIGLHTWLPDAMEGPTPVSALIHAATLVTAGIFLIIRCSPLFEFAESSLLIIMVIGGFTSFFAATVAITQDDIKKVIAYSTCSQLGYMIFICGLSEYNLGLFHLVNHAFFKALLFLGAGSVIHSMSGEQDMRKFGSLTNLIPYTYSIILIGFLALSGFPFLSGFYSKDLILEITFSKYSIQSLFAYWLGTISAFLTAFYSFRVLYYTFWENIMSFKYYVQQIHELPKNMAIALLGLSIGSLFSGFLLKDLFIGFGNIFWGNSIYKSILYNTFMDIEFLPLLIKNIPLFFSFFGIFLAIILNTIVDVIYNKDKLVRGSKPSIEFPQSFVNIIWFLNHKWYFDYIYNYYIGYSILKYSYEYFYKLLDKGFIEILNPQGLGFICYSISIILSKRQLGFIYHLNFLLVLGIILTICILLIF